MKTALFPGSFNPFTRGHADIVARALTLFDRVVIGVGTNAEKAPAVVEEIVEPIRSLYAGDPRIEVAAFTCLTAQFARQTGASCIVRGVRSLKDFEYERDMADVNRQLSGIETVILFSKPDLAAVSSSLVRELESYGADITPYLPEP